MNDDLKWQTRDIMDNPTNALQQLRETMTRQSRDLSEDKMLAFMYGIIVGWDDNSYEELKEQHEWSNETVDRLKMLHINYNKAWNLFIEDL